MGTPDSSVHFEWAWCAACFRITDIFFRCDRTYLRIIWRSAFKCFNLLAVFYDGVIVEGTNYFCWRRDPTTNLFGFVRYDW